MENLLRQLNGHYPMTFDRVIRNRDMGSTSYVAYVGERPYFLRSIKPALADTARNGVQVQQFLAGRGFPVPAILPTADGRDWVEWEEGLLVLYEFIEGEDVDPEVDAEAIGALTGRLHREMRDYRGELVRRDRAFYLGRYIATLEKMNYPRVGGLPGHGPGHLGAGGGPAHGLLPRGPVPGQHPQGEGRDPLCPRL